ncbi:type II secretory pathway pseudopilin PulG [Paucibacter oligotrophus]|uniref:Type II secretory pathway pseudopilin PulG n=1 Tax=Roseateles oligotrophus TaxID=1769250 RepID=A0A840L5M7_9BURK|nr:hypothetical protein [Roseateles oligotrophus]MBB4841528.1 type II secretory pathway pseudopilin PulG [Roseateles oligotrophus]
MNKRPNPPSHRPARQPRGVALLEALLALLIMAFGMLALAGLQNSMRRSADLAKQRGEAVRLAQQEMEWLRSFSLATPPVNADPNVLAFDDILARTLNTDAGSNTNFTVVRTIDSPLDLLETQRKDIRVSVTWTDRSEGAQIVTLDSILSRSPPSLGVALGLAPDATPVRRPGGRDGAIPLNAKDLGDKSSVFRPSPSTATVWVFNNLTGVITGVCNLPNTPVADISPIDIEACRDNALGFLLSGFVRFSAASPSDPGKPVGTALPMNLELLRSDEPTLLPSYQCFHDAPYSLPSTQTFVAYYCIVYPKISTSTLWSGRLNIVDIPLSGPSAKTICRYSADYDGDNKIGNAEHPADYVSVGAALSRQNFLVIPSGEQCPSGHAVDPSQGWFSNTATEPHQTASP